MTKMFFELTTEAKNAAILAEIDAYVRWLTEESYRRGYADGQSAEAEFTADEIESAYDDGFSNGFAEGECQGFNDGAADGYDEGYEDGHADGVDESALRAAEAAAFGEHPRIHTRADGEKLD